MEASQRTARGSIALLERDAELPRLAALVDGVLAGAGGRAVVHGEAGVGKTRLLQHARELARERGVDVLEAQGSELEEEYAFGLVCQLLEPAVRALGEQERAALFDGPAAMAAAVLVGAPEEADGSADVSFARMRALHAVAEAVARRRPTLLLVDDGHWGDAASLRFLAFLTRRLRGTPLGIVLATRDADGDEVRQPVLDALLADPQVDRLTPRPLSEAAVARLLEERWPGEVDPQFARACFELTLGNPLLVDQVLREAADDGVRPSAEGAEALRALGPGSIARAILGRLRRTDATTLEVARWLAVAGDASDLGAIAALAGVGDGEVRGAVDALCGAGVLERDAGGRLRFLHPVVRTAIHRDIPPAQRSARHAASARVLRERGAGDDVVAAHLLASDPGGDPETVAALTAAAQRATALGAHDTAVAYLRRAVAEPPAADERGRVLLALARAEGRVGDARSLDHLLEGYGLETTPEVRAETGVELAATLMAADRFAAAVPLLTELADELADERPELAMQVEAALVNAARFDPGHADVTEARRSSIETHLAREPESAAGRSLLAGLAFDAAMRARPAAEVVPLAQEALRGELLPWDMGRDLSFGKAVHALAVADELEAADRHLAWALDRCRRRGSAAGLTWLNFFRAFVGLRLGRLEQAEADALAAVEIADAGDLRGWKGAALAFLLEIRLERGDDDGAQAVYERLLDERANQRLAIIAVCALRGEGLWLLHAGDAERALETFRRLAALDASWQVLNSAGWTGWRSGAVEALRRLERVEEARPLAAAEVEQARAIGAPRALSRALRAAASVAPGAGRVALLEEALACAQRSPAELERAWAAYDLGAALRRQGTPAQARELLSAALAGAERCGAGALARLAHEELLAAGARPRRAATSGPDALTPSERRIARLAAEGLTNAQIAGELVVTRKTVEMHLRNVFRKLDLTSRTQLPGALGGEDLSA